MFNIRIKPSIRCRKLTLYWRWTQKTTFELYIIIESEAVNEIMQPLFSLFRCINHYDNWKCLSQKWHISLLFFAQGLPLVLLHQSFFVMSFYIIFLASASWVARIIDVTHLRPATIPLLLSSLRKELGKINHKCIK
jgi:hypothetical protein